MSNKTGRDRRSLHPAWRLLLILLGTGALLTGLIGIFVPGLPTTPFLLIAAGCYARSSERLYRWLTSRSWYQESVGVFLQKRALPLKVKIWALVLAWGLLGYLALFVVESFTLKLLILALALAKTFAMILIKTA